MLQTNTIYDKWYRWPPWGKEGAAVISEHSPGFMLLVTEFCSDYYNSKPAHMCFLTSTFMAGECVDVFIIHWKMQTGYADWL